MFYIEEIQLNDAADLLASCGLTQPRGVDYTAGVFSMEGNGAMGGSFGSGPGRLVATGSLKGDMIQGVAVDPDFQGEDLTAKVLTHLFDVAGERGCKTLYLFTKPEKVMQFVGLGFRQTAKARPYAALLEWGDAGVQSYMDNLRRVRETVVSEKNCGENPPSIGGLVMNCNPFTLGHRYLIEEAAKRKDHVFVLAVEEDISLFSFGDRRKLLQRGTADLKNVTVISGGRYAVSTLTFPSYFTREENLAKAHAAIDCELFAACIAPALGIDERFLGTEPLSAVTEIYNETLKERLPKRGITVTEIPRLETSEQVISATAVRAELRKLWETQNLTAEAITASLELKKLLPETTMEYLGREEVLKRLADRFEEMELRESHG